MEAAKFEAVVHQEKEKPSPLVQGGLEIMKCESHMGVTRKSNHTWSKSKCINQSVQAY